MKQQMRVHTSLYTKYKFGLDQMSGSVEWNMQTSYHKFSSLSARLFRLSLVFTLMSVPFCNNAIPVSLSPFPAALAQSRPSALGLCLDVGTVRQRRNHCVHSTLHHETPLIRHCSVPSLQYSKSQIYSVPTADLTNLSINIIRSQAFVVT